ncbi:MAG: 2-C-methyl-D-erythritol 4-phosphate cytidylyltransferase [Opitutales bacterium]
MKAELILLAAGSGQRMGGAVQDKVLAPVDGRPVLARALDAFLGTGRISRVIVVCRDAVQEAALGALFAEERWPVPHVCVRGGAERADSVRAGLAVTEEASPLVAIHDGARPLIRSATIHAALEAAGRVGAAVVAHRVTDTIKRVPMTAPNQPLPLEDLDRLRLWAMETPQVFRRDWIVEGYRRAAGSLTDDAAAVSALGHPVCLVENPFPNPKVTHADDLAWVEHLLHGARP